MAYILYKSNGVKLATIEDGSIDKSSTSLTLVGKNYSGYGQSINQNLIKLTENFAHNTQPLHSLTGQLWYDSGTKSLKVYNGTRYRRVSVIDNGSVGKPSDAVEGNFYFDDTDQKLYYYNGIKWLLVGPQFTGLTSDNLIVPVQKYSTGGTEDTHFLLLHQLQVGNVPTIAAITAAESFTLGTGAEITGFSTIKPGIVLSGANPTTGVSYNSTTKVGSIFWGTAADSVLFNGKPLTDFVTKAEPVVSARLTVNSDLGISVGTSGSLVLRVDTVNTFKEAVISAPASANVLRFYVKSSQASEINILNLDSGSGLALLPSKETTANTDIGADPNNTLPGRKPFATIYGNNIKATKLIKTGVYNSDAERDDGVGVSVEYGTIILNGTTFQGYTPAGWVNLN